MREPIPTWTFVLAIVCKDDRYLLVQERKHGNTWYLPAGRVEPGERLREAIVRETMEEAGIPIEITGIFRIERQADQGSVWQRVLYSARPSDERPPKDTPDSESLGAAWKTLEEIAALPLRGDSEVIDILKAFKRRGAVPAEIIEDD